MTVMHHLALTTTEKVETVFHTNSTEKKQVQFSSVPQSCPTLYDPMDCSTPGFAVHHQLPEFAQTRVHRVGDASKKR